MKRMWNVSMVEIFGAMAANVTVHDLIYMRSGIADFEELPGGFDQKYLYDTPNQTHSPLETFQFVGNQPGPFGCLTGNCTWLFEPGTQGYYSTTNFMLAGLIMLNYAPDGRNDWKTYDQAAALGLDTVNDYKHIRFPPLGPAKDVGLTAPGDSWWWGNQTEVWTQD